MDSSYNWQYLQLDLFIQGKRVNASSLEDSSSSNSSIGLHGHTYAYMGVRENFVLGHTDSLIVRQSFPMIKFKNLFKYRGKTAKLMQIDRVSFLSFFFLLLNSRVYFIFLNILNCIMKTSLIFMFDSLDILNK